MRCFFPNMRPVLLSLLTAAVLCVPAVAGTYSYSNGTGQRTINAGILLNDGNTSTDDGSNPAGEPLGPDNPDPYIFYILNQRSDIKPFGWNIVNPLAPKTVTGDIQLRWDARTSADGAGSQGDKFRQARGGHVYDLNQAVTPDMAAYWEVSLSNSRLDDLLQYDILMINLRGYSTGKAAGFSAADVEKLRRYVDAGGQLWVEDCGGGRIATSAPLFFDIQFNSGGTRGFASLPPFVANKPLVLHPIISTPYLLTREELNALGDKQVSSYYHSGTGGANDVPAPGVLVTVVGNSAHKDVNGNPQPLISAGQLGAGQVIVTSQDSGCAINDFLPNSFLIRRFGGNSGPYCPTDAASLAVAPTRDLKFLSNMLSWSNAHPNEHKNSHGNSSTQNSLSASVNALWSYTPGFNLPALLPGAAIEGDLTYVRDAAGVLHAFDLFPAEDVDGNGKADDGIVDYVLGKPYDEVWNSTSTTDPGPFSSAPTVASVPLQGGKTTETVVLVEQANGKILAYNATTGLAATVATLNPGVSGSYSATTGPAPAPTYYSGRLYAGQPDGSLYVYDYQTGVGVKIPIADPGGPGERVLQPPTVGIVSAPEGENDIVAAVTTNRFVYTVFLGARGERLRRQVPGTYATKLLDLNPAVTIDNSGFHGPRAYTVDGTTGYPQIQVGLTPSGGTFTGTDFGTEPVLADYDVDFRSVSALGNNPGQVINRVNFAGASQQYYGAGFTGDNFPVAGLSAPSFSAPALDRNGNVYFTVNDGANPNGVNSAILCVHDSPPNRGTPQIKWRFRLPFAGEPVVDADNVGYNQLAGFHFVGAPVVDSDGNVYAAVASDPNVSPGRAGVLCFNGNASATASVFPAGQEQRVNISDVKQPFPTDAGGSVDEFGQAANSIGGRSQDDRGRITFNNMGQYAPRSLYPVMSEPQSVVVTYTQEGQAQAPVVVPVRTNLNWYTLTDGVNANTVTGLTQVGRSLYFAATPDGATDSTLYKVNAGAQSDGTFIDFKFIKPSNTNTAGKPMVTTIATTGVGIVGALPSSSGSAMILNGSKGVAALASQATLIADNNRIIELDSDGDALWAVDSTTKYTVEGGDLPFYNGGQPPATPPTGKYVSTELELNRPSYVAQLGLNDYLVADTGNNRAVRFDRAGQVIWELTRVNDQVTTKAAFGDASTETLFNKTQPILAPGEPDTLNQPTSVSIRRTYFKDTFTDANGNTVDGQGTVYHYLVSDSGNFRVMEIVDVFRADGSPLGPLHNVAWISHTRDKQGRQYRYQSAEFYRDNNGTPFVVALVTNTRIAFTNPPNRTAPPIMGAANADAPGASIVLLDYDPAGTVNLPGHKDGFLYSVVPSIAARLTANGEFSFNNADPVRTLQVSNPRYLKAYTAPPVQTDRNAAGNPTTNFLLADDNGAFDVTLTPDGKTLVAQWGFTQADYRKVGTPIDLNGSLANNGKGDVFARAKLLFVPGSIQRVATETLISGTSKLSFGRYLVTNTFGQGEANGRTGTPPGFGGEALELHVTLNAGNLGTREVHETNVANTFNGRTFSRPANTGALIQPTFATRLR